MTRLIEVPTQFDDRSFDQFAAAYAQATDGGGGVGGGGERLLFDAHAAEWASPYGLVGLLAAGEAATRKGERRERPLLTAPANPDVASYWARAGFFREAADLFEIHGKVPKVKVAVESDVLLPVTPVRAAEDVHAVVSTIQQRASAILSTELGLDPKATMGFAMALSESCQNIVEHAGTGGWVAVQAYNWRRKLARRVVVIAVADAGIGFRHSLEPTQAKRFGERWGDAAALEAAVIQGVSRFRDPGRGQGLAGIRRYLARWEGKIAIRSGTARIAIVPRWDDDVPLKDGLPAFPGSQVLLIIPEQESEKRPGGPSKR
jgi:histidine kinase/DNA gyrase B/HSP90-like ATPase